MVIVENNNIDVALRKFRSQVQEEGKLTEYKKHMFYVAPAQKKREKRAKAKVRALKEQRKREKYLNAWD